MRVKKWLLYEPKKFSEWRKFTFILGLFSIFVYLPALVNNYDLFGGYQSINLSSIITGRLNVYVFPGWWDKGINDYSLSWEMETARVVVRGQQDYYNVHTVDPQIQVAAPTPQVPLWRWDDRDGGRPFLAISSGPFLYPFTWIFYWFNLSFFAAFHFWLALLGAFLLSTYLPQRLKPFVRPLMFFLLITFLPQIRFDIAAGFAWWLVGVALALTLSGKSITLNLAILSFILAMLLLAVGPPTSLILIISLVVWWLFVGGWKNNWQVVPIVKGLAGIFLAVGIGFLLAGPQLFPRLFDRMEDYQLLPDHAPIYLPLNVSLNSVTRIGQTEMIYNLTVESSLSPLQLTIPERYDTGWTAQYRTNLNSTYQPTLISRTEQGWRSLTLPPTPNATILELRTVFDPTSFRIGIWSLLFGLFAWLLVSGFAVYPFLAKALSDYRASLNVVISNIK